MCHLSQYDLRKGRRCQPHQPNEPNFVKCVIIAVFAARKLGLYRVFRLYRTMANRDLGLSILPNSPLLAWRHLEGSSRSYPGPLRSTYTAIKSVAW